MNFIVRNGHVLNTAGNNDEFSFPNCHLPVPELHQKRSLDHEKELVFVFVVMPDKLALELHQFHKRIVQLSDDLRRPVVGEEGKFMGKIDGMDHGMMDDVGEQTSERMNESTSERISEPTFAIYGFTMHCRRIFFSEELVQFGQSLGKPPPSESDAIKALMRMGAAEITASMME